MMRPPVFWSGQGHQWIATALHPLSLITTAATARRVARSGWRAPVPVICCGNVTVGGAGKTTVALDIGRRLLSDGHAVHFILRGYGGEVRATHRVDASDSAVVAGDEALLLSDVAPTWIGPDRAKCARAAIATGATVLVMDDGLQNPTLLKDLSLFIVDGASGFGNGRVIPAGPLREPIAAAAARCDAAVVIGESCPAMPSTLPILRARLVPAPNAHALSGKRVLAFAGIGVPEKFFATLAEIGAIVVRRIAFPDHHRYRPSELNRLLDEARQLEAVSVTTAKDFVRIPAKLQGSFAVVRITLAWKDEAAIKALLTRAMDAVS